MTDRDLLTAYTRSRSQDAFAELVRRHVHLVHAAAMRQTRGDAHLADEVTQAVFIVLARRASTITDRATLPGWLVRTTRYAALAALKSQSRRRHHERKAAAMTPGFSEPSDGPIVADNDLSAFLDDALARLPARHRAALTLRYLQGRPPDQVAAALGISEPAARKRIRRALDHLRARFARQGLSTPAAALESFLSAQSAHTAPAPLIALLCAPTFHAAAAGGAAGSIATAATKALAAAHAKLVLAASAAAIALAAGVTVPTVHYLRAPDFIPAPPVTRAPDAYTFPPNLTVHIQHILGNSSNFRDRDVPGYHIGHAPDPARGPRPATFIKSVTPNPTQASCDVNLPAAFFVSRRMRLTIWARTVDVRDGATFQLTVNAAGFRPLVAVDSADHPIRGTTGWHPYHLVIDIPRDIDIPIPPQADITINVRATLRGPGELWTHDLALDAVPASAPTPAPENASNLAAGVLRSSTHDALIRRPPEPR